MRTRHGGTLLSYEPPPVPATQAELEEALLTPLHIYRQAHRLGQLYAAACQLRLIDQAASYPIQGEPEQGVLR